jgi:plastocyanin
VAPAAASRTQADVTIKDFLFGPGTLQATAGKAVTWVNTDASPHQVTILRTKERSPIILKGQSGVIAFNAAGTYEYICGLHPNMKGTVEVK